MYKYIRTRNFAGISKDGVSLDNPQTIDDIYSFEELPDITKWKITDTPSQEEKILVWHELKDSTKTILICDRVLVNHISAEDLSSYIRGVKITIDNEDFICRLISSGTVYEDRYNGTKDKREWDFIIGGDQNIVGLPPISGNNISYNYARSNSNTSNNMFWNWHNVGTMTSNHLEGDYIVRGNYAPNFIYEKDFSTRGDDFGWRPILEKVVEEPVIEGTSGRLGEYKEPFIYNYTLKSYSAGEDYLNATIKLDGNIIEQGYIESNIEKQLDLNEYWDGLYKGRHTIEIEAINDKGLSATKIVSFNTPTPTFVDKEGLAYFATQLWNTKIKTFVADFSKRQGGLILDANESFTGDGQIVEDEYADCGKSISTTIDTSAKLVAKFTTDAIKLGKHGLVIRGNVSEKVNAETIEVTVSASIDGELTPLQTKKFKSSDFKEVNKFSTLYMSFDYNTKKVSNQSLEIEVKTLVSSSSHSFKLDYVLISPILPSVYSN